MDNEQLEKRIKWLDDERRKDKTIISELENRLLKGNPRRLRARLQPEGTGRQHDRLEIHACIGPASPHQVAVHSDKQTDRRPEERIVLQSLAGRGLAVAFLDTKDTIKLPADPPAAVAVLVLPFAGIVPVILVRRGLTSVRHGENVIGNCLLDRTGANIGVPGLGVGARGRALGDL